IKMGDIVLLPVFTRELTDETLAASVVGTLDEKYRQLTEIRFRARRSFKYDVPPVLRFGPAYNLEAYVRADLSVSVTGDSESMRRGIIRAGVSGWYDLNDIENLLEGKGHILEVGMFEHGYTLIGSHKDIDSWKARTSRDIDPRARRASFWKAKPIKVTSDQENPAFPTDKPTYDVAAHKDETLYFGKHTPEQRDLGLGVRHGFHVLPDQYVEGKGHIRLTGTNLVHGEYTGVLIMINDVEVAVLPTQVPVMQCDALLSSILAQTLGIVDSKKP
ncbi:MAG: hypothetical protein ABIA93_06475, partial [Candidatus Woesearchaeota archaeon]